MRVLPKLSLEELRSLRLRGHGLAPREALTPAEVCRRVAGIQAQEPAAAALAIRARSTTATPGSVTRAWADDRTIVQTWTLRGTLHFHAAEDLAWLLPLLGRAMIAKDRRRMTQLGVTDAVFEEALPRLRHALRHGPATRAELVERLHGLSIDLAGQAVPHLLYRAAFERAVCRGPLRGHKETYVLLEDWLPGMRFAAAADAARTLAQRFFEAYGPASKADLAAWSGLPAGLVAAAIASLRDDLEEVEAGGARMWLPKARGAGVRSPGAVRPAVNLLGRFDTYLIGYADRGVADPSGHVRRLTAGGGIIHPAVLEAGAVRGTWRAKGGRPPVTVTWFEEPSPLVEDAARAEVAEVERWLEALNPRSPR